MPPKRKHDGQRASPGVKRRGQVVTRRRRKAQAASETISASSQPEIEHGESTVSELITQAYLWLWPRQVFISTQTSIRY